MRAVERHVTLDANFCIRKFLSETRPSYPVEEGFMSADHVTPDHDASHMQRRNYRCNREILVLRWSVRENRSSTSICINYTMCVYVEWILMYL